MKKELKEGDIVGIKGGIKYKMYYWRECETYDGQEVFIMDPEPDEDGDIWVRPIDRNNEPDEDVTDGIYCKIEDLIF